MLEFKSLSVPGLCEVLDCDTPTHGNLYPDTKRKVCHKHYHLGIRSLYLSADAKRYEPPRTGIDAIIYDRELSFTEKLAKVLGEETEYEYLTVGTYV